MLLTAPRPGPTDEDLAVRSGTITRSLLPLLSIVTALGVLTVTTACSTSSTDDVAASSPGTSATVPTSGRVTYPLTVRNCGREVTFTKAPQRVASLYQASTEVLLSLGLGDKMVGTSTWFDPVLPSLAAANAKVPRIADNDPSLESVLDLEPDLVTSANAHTFTPAVVADRDRFAGLGINTYQSPSVCDDATVDGENVSRTQPLKIDTLFKEITELAAIFDVTDRGQALIATLRARLSAATDSVSRSGQSVAFWFSGVTTPYMAGCCSAPGMYASVLGARNVFADTKEDWPEVSWESVADRDPDVLVLADLQRKRIDGDALATKKEFLVTNKATRDMRAVRAQRYVVMTGSELDPGIREIDAIEKLAAGLKNAQ